MNLQNQSKANALYSKIVKTAQYSVIITNSITPKL